MVRKIYLEPDEEITSAIDRILKTKADQVAVVIPKGANVTQSIVNLKLLKRQIDRHNQNVYLITADRDGFSLAQKAGLLVTDNPSKPPQEPPAVEPSQSLETEELEDMTPRNKLNLRSLINNQRQKDPAAAQQKEDLTGLVADLKKNIAEEKSTPSSTIPGGQKIKSSPQGSSAGSPNQPPARASDQKLNRPSTRAAKKEPRHNFSLRKIGSSSEKKSQPQTRSNRFAKKKKLHLLPSFSVKGVAIFFGLCFLVFGAIIFLLLPKAEISLIPKTEPFTTNFQLVVDQEAGELDLENGVIPGEVTSLEKESDEKKFPTSGIKEIGQTAKGTIIIANSFSSEPQQIVATTRFLSSGGQIFRGLSDVTIPGAKIEGGQTIPGEIAVQVEAEAAGEEYNLEPTSFTIPGLPPAKQKAITGQSEQAFSGGSTQKIKILSQEDLDRAAETVSTEIFEKLSEEISGTIPRGKKFYPSALRKEITKVKSNFEVGQETEEFKIQVTTKATTILFGEDDLKNLVEAKLANAIPPDKFIVDPNLEEGIEPQVENFDPATGVLGTKIIISKTVAKSINLDELRANLTGKSEAEIKEYLQENPNIIDVQIDFWPFWVKESPIIEKKIELYLDT